MVLSPLIGKFCLQKKIVARDESCAIRGSQSLPDSFFEVMPPLVCRVNAAKTHAERQFGEGCSAVLFPGGAVEKIGKELRRSGWHLVILIILSAMTKC